MESVVRVFFHILRRYKTGERFGFVWAFENMNDYRMVGMILRYANQIGLLQMRPPEVRLRNGDIFYVAEITKGEGVRARL